MQRALIAIAHGRLRLRTLSFAVAEGTKPARAIVRGAGPEALADLRSERDRVHLTLPVERIVRAGETLEFEIS